MAQKSEMFYNGLLTREIADAVTNDFGKEVLRLPNQGRGEVRDEVAVYFSAMAIQQVNAIATKHGVDDQLALHELYQLMRNNFLQGFRIGQSMKSKWTAS